MLLLYVDPDNTKAIALCRDAFGFADAGEVATDPRKWRIMTRGLA